MRALPLAMLGLAAYAVFLAATTPASFVAARVAEATRGRAQLLDAQGTLWQGAGRAVIASPGALPVALENLDWRFNPWRLIAGEASFATRFTVANAAAGLEAARGFSGWKVRQLAVKGDASGIVVLVPYLAAWQPGGEVALTAPLLAWDGQALAGEALLEWRNASTSLSTVKPLGSYRAVLQAEGGPAKVAVTTVEGALRITGQGTLSPATGLAFAGEARAVPAQAAELEPLLGLLGPKRPDGAVALDWRAR